MVDYSVSVATKGRCGFDGYPVSRNSVATATVGRCLPDIRSSFSGLKIMPDRAISARGR